MTTLLAIQLITSFFAGGSVIALQSLIGEKVSKRTAGVILSFPTTVALGFFFLGWTISSESVAEIVPSTLIPLGIAILFIAIYASISSQIKTKFPKKLHQIIVSYTLSIGFWSLMVIPITNLKIDNLTIGLMGYFLLMILTHKVMHRNNFEKPAPLIYTTHQKFGRAIFVGSIVFFTVLLGKTLGPYWGGMFSMFPAGFSSLCILIHWYYGTEAIFPTMQRIPIGSLSMLTYAFTAMVTFPKIGFILGTLIAYLASALVSVLLLKYQPQPKLIRN